MRKFKIKNGEIEIANYNLFTLVLHAIWGPCADISIAEDVDLFGKLGHPVAGWVDGGGVGWIVMPSFVAEDRHVEVKV